MGSVNHELLVRSIVRAAVAANSANPKAALTAIISGHYSTTVQDGRVLISATEDAGSTLFAMPSGMSPIDLMALCEEAIQFIEAQPDQTNINLKTRMIKGLRVSFADKNFAAN